MRYGIDWISIRQKHTGAKLHASEMLLRYDLETKQAVETARGYTHKGSFDDAVTVRSYGDWVSWSGNPARWGKADNLAPICMAEAIRIINRHMDALDLPRFTAAVPDSAPLLQDGSRADEFCGAILTRVDLCRTWMTGEPAAAGALLQAMSTATYQNKKASIHRGEAASWGGLPNLYLKWYLKGPELAAHTAKQGLHIHRQYRRALAEWCTENGVVRWEVGFGRNALRRYGLRYLSDWNQEQAETIAERIRGGMKVGATYSINKAYDAFLAAGFSHQRALTASGLVDSWYAGRDVWGSFPIRARGDKVQSAYNYRKWILDVMGIDIRSEPNVIALTTRIREVELAPLALPDWYRHAA